MTPVFVTGGTGYLGRPLVAALLARGRDVHALVRPGSEARLPTGARRIVGDALDETTFASAIPAGATIVHLVGTPHPNPSKAAEFQRVDLGSIRATTAAARHARARHLVYVSVAHPAPVMQAYVAARQQGEALVSSTGYPRRFSGRGMCSARDTTGRICWYRSTSFCGVFPARATPRFASGW